MPVIHTLVHADIGAEGIAACPPGGERVNVAGTRSVSRDAERKILAAVEVLDRLTDRRRLRLLADRALLRLLLRLCHILSALLIDVDSNRSGIIRNHELPPASRCPAAGTPVYC